MNQLNIRFIRKLKQKTLTKLKTNRECEYLIRPLSMTKSIDFEILVEINMFINVTINLVFFQ